MAFKQFAISELGNVKVYKRRGSRSMRLSVTPSGEVRLTIPSWTPYSAGLAFARSRHEWILSQQQSTRPKLAHGQAIGKAHRLYFIQESYGSGPKSRVRQGEITVSYPSSMGVLHADVQLKAETACFRALRAQSESLLPLRLKTLADTHGMTYKSLRVKRLKSRWGSCDQDKNIVLNLFLMQLPWELIDYVLLHELTHTRHLHHGPDFWATLEQMSPNAKILRKTIKTWQPVLGATPS